MFAQIFIPEKSVASAGSIEQLIKWPILIFQLIIIADGDTTGDAPGAFKIDFGESICGIARTVDLDIGTELVLKRVNDDDLTQVFAQVPGAEVSRPDLLERIFSSVFIKVLGEWIWIVLQTWIVMKSLTNALGLVLVKR
jgi:hypothetical protein